MCHLSLKPTCDAWWRCRYIPKEAAAATLKEMGELCGRGSTVFVSYVDELLETNPAGCCGRGYAKPEALQLVPRLAARVGEPWISYYSPPGMKTLLSSCGFELSSDLTLEDVNDLYFGAVGRTVPQEQMMLLERFAVGKK